MQALDLKSIIFPFLGGLGIFLFSIKYMGDGLKLIAGDKIRYVLDKYTKNPFYGILVGIIITILLQSSSAATVITVGLVSVGLLNLEQAIGIVMGANIGTTVTSFIIGFNLSGYALPIMFLGAAFLFFTSNQKFNNIGRFLFGFGGIFYALKLMSGAMVPLRHLEEFRQFLINVGNSPIYGAVLGTVLTVLIQSSAATIGILQNLYTEGLITLRGSLPILFGDNIGTTITAVLSVIGANVSAKRVATVHVLFNLIGTIIFIILLTPFTYLVTQVAILLNLNEKLQIAMAHGMFNVFNTIIMFPFIGTYAYIVKKIIPSSSEEDEKREEHYLDRKFLDNPVIALSQSNKEMLYMYGLATKNFDKTLNFLYSRDIKMASKIERREDKINEIDMELTKYLSEIFAHRLSEKESDDVTSYIDITRDIERIGDHANVLTKEITYYVNKNIHFSTDAISEIKHMHEIILELFKITSNNLNNPNNVEISEIYRLHNLIYEEERKARKNHIKRMKEGECDIKSGLQYVDVINHLTRVCDHIKNINEKI